MKADTHKVEFNASRCWFFLTDMIYKLGIGSMLITGRPVKKYLAEYANYKKNEKK